MMYSKITAYLQENDTLSAWQDLQNLVVSIINEKPRHIKLPGLIAGCYSSSPESVFAASASLALAFAGIIVLDDVLDGDHRFGGDNETLANMGAGLFALASQPLASIASDPQQVLKGQTVLNELIFKVALGQSLDVQNPETEEGYWQVAALKSGAFFSGAFQLGGLAGGAGAEDLFTLRLLGEEYGIMLQVHDDLRDVLESPANSDWLNGRLPLPILFAHLVEHPERARFDAIRAKVADPETLKEAQEILLRSGAVSYGLFQIEEHYQAAQSVLTRLSIQDREPLEKLFTELMDPVNEMVRTYSTS